MNNKWLFLTMAAILSAPAAAEVKLYGKANISFQAVDENGDSFSELVSNASRIGVKGTETINDSLEAIYQFEYETAVDDGQNSNDETFNQRNIFIGVKGEFGTVIAGHFDTPLKAAQNKVDLFNDLEGDIKNLITVNDKRASNQVNYRTPSSLGPVTVSVSVISSEQDDVDDGISTSVAFEQNGLYLAAAIDRDVSTVDEETIDKKAARLVAQYNFRNFQVGGLYESFDDGMDSYDGFLVSGQYQLHQWALKAQFGQSDIDEEGGESLSLGADYKLSENTTLFGYLTTVESDVDTDADYLGVGIEHKF